MIDDNLPMSPTAGSLINVYDQNFNGLGTTIELFNKQFEDERITRSKGKEVLNFSALSTSNIYQYLQTENIIEFGGRWFRIKYAEDDTSTKGLTHYDCYALWYELAEGAPTPLKEVGSTIGAVANAILEPFGKWVELVIPTELQNRSVNSITLQENSALYKLRYLAKRFNLEITFGYREVIENELRYVKTVVFLQQYTESKIEFPLVVEENLKHIARTEDSRNLVTAYKISGKSENDEEEFTFAEINGGNDYLVDTSWFTSRGMRPRIIPKAKKDDRYTIKQSMLDAARSYLDIYAKPLVSYEASAILYEEIPNLHQSQLVIDDTYSIVEWRKVSSRKLNYDDLTSSIIVFDDPRQDLMDLLNDDGDGALSPTEESDSRTIIRYANDAMGNGFNDTSGAYIGVLVTKKKVSELGPHDFSWHKIKGEEGPQGPPGRDGVDGIAGKDGVGIIETQVSYYLSTSGTTKPQTGWTEDVPPLVKGRYLWTRTIWRYSDGQLETGYSVAYVGQDGNNGSDGIAGKDGVGINSTSITYASSSSGTTVPTSGWTASVPNVSQGQYLWTRTIWNYSDNTNETGYSVAKMGADGKSSYTHTAYAWSSDGTDRFTTVYPKENFLTNTSFKNGLNNWSANSWTIDNNVVRNGNPTVKGVFTGASPAWENFTQTVSINGLSENDDVVWSVWAKSDSAFGELHLEIWGSEYFTNINVGTDWTRISIKGKLKSVFSVFVWNTKAGTYWISEPKLEKGTELTPYVPASSEDYSNAYPAYIGIYTNSIEEGSNNPNDYTWTRILGQGGVDGKTQYTHIAYADNETGGGFSQTDQTKAYIGMYQDFTATNSANPASYKWTKWKGSDGDQGIPGPKGEDGQTPYVHFAYSDNADGTDLTTSDNGQRYIGHYSDYTQADSTDKTKYKWADRRAKIEVNGRNLAQKTSSEWSNPYTSFSGTANTCPPLYKVLIDDLKVGDTLKSRIVLKYTDIIPASRQTSTIYPQGDGNITSWYDGRYSDSPVKPISGSGEMVFEHEFKITADHLKNDYWNWMFRTDYIASGSLQWRLAKVEKGTVFTGWSPAPEDVENKLDTKADQALTQQQLNLLIEKAQLMQTELEAKVAMETLSDLERAYNAYIESNDKAVAKSEADLIETGRRVDAMVETLGGLSKTKKFIDTYIKEAEEGIIIGTNDNVSQIRVTYDRIAMYSAGKEVMYISQGVIHIDNGIFTKSLQVGRFRTEQHQTNLDINVCRYVG